MTDTYQTIILTTKDGKEARFTGPTQLSPDDRIVRIRATEPEPLPKDYTFERIKL